MLHPHRTLSWAKIVRRGSLLRVAVQQLALQSVDFDDPAQFLGADWPGHERPASVEIVLDVEQLIYEATTLLNGASLINRCAKS